MPDLSLIIPTYNERDHVAPLLEQVFAACTASRLDAEVIIVDDNSPDGTGQCAARLADRWPLRVVHRPCRLGLGSAVLAGCAVAGSDVIAVMDADLSHPPQLLPSMVSALSRHGLDMVVASRYVTGGGTTGWPLSRRVMSRLACWAARPFTAVRDPMSGYFVIRRHRMAGLKTRAAGFKIGLELLVRSGPGAVAELPYVFANRLAGRSKMGLREVVRFGRQLASLAVFRLSPRFSRASAAPAALSPSRSFAPGRRRLRARSTVGTP